MMKRIVTELIKKYEARHKQCQVLIDHAVDNQKWFKARQFEIDVILADLKNLNEDTVHEPFSGDWIEAQRFADKRRQRFINEIF